MFGYDGRSPPLINQLTRSRMYENVSYVAPRFLPAILGVATSISLSVLPHNNRSVSLFFITLKMG